MLDSDIYEVLISAVESAACASSKWIGRKNNMAADQAAVNAMREVFLLHQFPGTVVIGEGERDKAPMLFIGETFSKSISLFDIAVDPLEGTNLCAYNQDGAMSVIAIGPSGTLLNAPDLYMKKLATGSNIHPKLIDLKLPFSEIVSNVAHFLDKSITEIKVTILNRERHSSIISEAQSLGVQLELIEDGDILAAINTTEYFNGSDLYYGIGGAPEGVLAAAAMKTLGGQFTGQLILPENVDSPDRDKIYNINDLVQGDVIFLAAGVTQSKMLDGYLYSDNRRSCNILLCHYSKKLFRKILSTQLNIG
jgi:fructose-1,6-bisphosphatase class II